MDFFTTQDELLSVLSRLEGSTGFFLNALESMDGHGDLLGMAGIFHAEASKARQLFDCYIEDEQKPIIG